MDGQEFLTETLSERTILNEATDAVASILQGYAGLESMREENGISRRFKLTSVSLSFNSYAVIADALKISGADLKPFNLKENKLYFEDLKVEQRNDSESDRLEYSEI